MSAPDTANVIAAVPAVLQLLAFGAGFILVLALRSRIRGASGLAAAGLGLLVLLSVWDLFWTVVAIPNIPVFLRDNHMSYSELNTLISVIGVVTGLVHLVAVALLVLAVFAGRRARQDSPAATAPLAANPVQGYAPQQPAYGQQPGQPPVYGQQPGQPAAAQQPYGQQPPSA